MRCGRSWGLSSSTGGRADGRTVGQRVTPSAGPPVRLTAREGQRLAGESLLVRYANFVRLPHTIFALPFALLGVVVASRTYPLTGRAMGLVILAFTCARFVAMGFNRIADRAADPRAGVERRAGRGGVVRGGGVGAESAVLRPLAPGAAVDRVVQLHQAFHRLVTPVAGPLARDGAGGRVSRRGGRREAAVVAAGG